MRSRNGFEKLQPFEVALANIASQCEYNHGAMGKTGYLYASVKDQIRWHGLKIKKYIKTIMTIGQVMALSDKDYEKEKVRAVKMPNTDIADVLIAAFGDGT